MQVDLVTTLLFAAWIIVAVFLAVLAGKLSARVFFDASSRKTDKDEV